MNLHETLFLQTGSTERPISDTPSKPAESAGIAGLPAKPVFGGGPTFGDNAFAGKNLESTANGNSFAAATTKKDDSPSSSASGGVLNGNTAADKKDDGDFAFAKPVTPVSEANGDSHVIKPSAVAAPLPLTEEAPVKEPGPSEPTATSIPTATAPSVTLITPTAPATNGSDAAPSLAAGLPAKPAEPVVPVVPAKPAEPAEPAAPSAVVGEKRKANEADDTPAAAKPPAPINSLLGGPTASSLPAKPPAPAAEAGTNEDGESAAKKLKTDTDAAAPKSTPAAPPVEVPAPSPVTVATPAADPIPAPVGAPDSVAPALEVNLGPAPSAEEIASTSTSGPGVKKSTSRAKREKKPLPAVGKTARKTRSQGAA